MMNFNLPWSIGLLLTEVLSPRQLAKGLYIQVPQLHSIKTWQMFKSIFKSYKK